MVYRVHIPAKPVGKQRPRATRAGRVFTPKQTVNAEAWVRLCCTEQVGAPCLQGALQVRVEVVLPIAPSWPARRRQEAARGALWPVGKPDADNVLKLVLDALNGIAWADDSQLVSVSVLKRYGPAPGMVVEWEAAPTEVAAPLL